MGAPRPNGTQEGDYSSPVGVAVHDGTLYWTQKCPSKGGHGSIHAAELTQLGADAVDPGTTLVDGLHEAIGLALDPEGSAVWVSDLSGTIYRVDTEATESTAVAHLDTPATGIVFV